MTLTSRHPGWVLMVLRKTSDQYLATCKVSTQSTNMVKRYKLTKTLTESVANVNVNAHDRGVYNSSMHFVQAS